jgi:L-lactate dehydrogenase complex protein LldG
MPARDRILARIRTALNRQAPEPHWLHEPRGDDALFPPPQGAPRELFDRFQRELAELHGEAYWMASRAEATQWIADRKLGRTLATEAPLLRETLQGVPQVEWIPPDCPTRAGWESAACGITPVLGLAAESGSILVAADLCGRAASVLPPVHIAVATPDQIVPDLAALLAVAGQRYGAEFPSAVSLVTGPSRTADIEKILVLGAHGPKRLVVLVVPPSGS